MGEVIGCFWLEPVPNKPFNPHFVNATSKLSRALAEKPL